MAIHDLAPTDFASAERNFRLVRRGYDAAEVEAFSYAVAQEISYLRQRQADLELTLIEVERRMTPRATCDDEHTVAAFFDDEASQVMEAVITTATELTAMAERTAVDAGRHAERHAAMIVRRAEDHASQLRRHAEEWVRRFCVDGDHEVTAARECADEAMAERMAEDRAAAETIRRTADEDAARLRADADRYAADVVAEAARQTASLGASTLDAQHTLSIEVESLIARRHELLAGLGTSRSLMRDAHLVLMPIADDTTRALPRPVAEAVVWLSPPAPPDRRPAHNAAAIGEARSRDFDGAASRPVSGAILTSAGNHSSPT